jgi:GntR family transcriptional regulator
MDLDYFKKTFTFSHANGVPLYTQLASYIQMQIKMGALKPGDKILPESSICETLNVSRTTVRQTMNALVEEGLLVRYRGRGTYVAEHKIKRNINHLYNFTENIKEAGASPSSVVLHNSVISADDVIASKMNLTNDQREVFFIERLRCANDEPIILEKTYIPYYMCKGIEKFDFSSLSLYDILNNYYGLNPYHAVETIEAILIEKDTSALLNCQTRDQGYRIERMTELDSGYIFEYTTSITRADKCVFKLDLYRNSAQGKNAMDFSRCLTI